MNDSKIGTWLERDGRTAIVLAEAPVEMAYTVLGVDVCVVDGRPVWSIVSWTSDGFFSATKGENRRDLIKKVSGSTELKPWKPEKKWRPWTIDEIKERMVKGLWLIMKKEGDIRFVSHTLGELTWVTSCGWRTPELLLEVYTQHDGTPCGVEVEE